MRNTVQEAIDAGLPEKLILRWLENEFFMPIQEIRRRINVDRIIRQVTRTGK